MKKIGFVLLLGVVLMSFMAAANSESESTHVKEQRELLKDYFLCKCLTVGFEEVQIDKYDCSPAVYFDIARYDPGAFHEVAAYAKEFVASIEPSPIEDLGHRKAIIIHCIDKYKTKEVDDFIKSMDRYMLND